MPTKLMRRVNAGLRESAATDHDTEATLLQLVGEGLGGPPVIAKVRVADSMPWDPAAVPPDPCEETFPASAGDRWTIHKRPLHYSYTVESAGYVRAAVPSLEDARRCAARFNAEGVGAH